MRALFLASVFLTLCSCISNPKALSTTTQEQSCSGDNTKPMFGYDDNHVINQCDQAFIDEVDRKSGGHREVGVREVRALGYEKLEKDPLTAIKRFNQAWLLDRTDPETFRAFADWEMKMGNSDRADQFRDRMRRLQKL